MQIILSYLLGIIIYIYIYMCVCVCVCVFTNRSADQDVTQGQFVSGV